jgi:hypothetical protein
VQTADDGSASVLFYQGDDVSTFEVEVLAQGPNGTKGKARIQYKVQ